ncbi:MAG: choice-of-anchor D domain-containing protein [Verrucomicrobiaceae bacterium]|nr:choice-of-anchor D domain-containing protein [Verrucomicrobiaceae bacterium]
MMKISSLLFFLALPVLLSAASVSTTFTYDAANRLTAASSNSYTQDKAGNLTAMSGPTAAAEIALQQQTSLDLTDGTSSLDFGAVSVGSSSLQAVIFIQNGGNANLDNLTVTKDGAHSADYTISSVGLPTSLVPGASAFITVTFSPSATGARTAALHVGNNDSNENPFDVTLTGTGQSLLTAFETWRQTHFGTTTNTGNAADDADPDHDGIQNLAEFAFGLDPNLSSTTSIPQPQLSGGSLSVSFTKPANVSGIAYDAESSTTLLPGSWNPVTNTGTFPTFHFSVPTGSMPKLFIRLKVSPLAPPPPPPPL